MKTSKASLVLWAAALAGSVALWPAPADGQTTATSPAPKKRYRLKRGELEFEAKLDRFLKAKGELNKLNADGETWLHQAARKGYRRSVSLLLARGADA